MITSEELKRLHPSLQHYVFENVELMQFEGDGKWDIPMMEPTQTTAPKMCRFMDWKQIPDPENYVACFYYDDYKFIQAWRDPDRYLDILNRFKAVSSPNFSLYTDFPRALQLLSCYRRNWVGAYWQYMGIDVIPNVCWGDKESFNFCFDGIPKHSSVTVSTVGIKRDRNWNGKDANMFLDGYNEMLQRLEPTNILVYGSLIDGMEGNVIQFPTYYDLNRAKLNERKVGKYGNGKQ